MIQTQTGQNTVSAEAAAAVVLPSDLTCFLSSQLSRQQKCGHLAERYFVLHIGFQMVSVGSPHHQQQKKKKKNICNVEPWLRSLCSHPLFISVYVAG